MSQFSSRVGAAGATEIPRAEGAATLNPRAEAPAAAALNPWAQGAAGLAAFPWGGASAGAGLGWLELVKKYDRAGPRYTSYPPANHFHAGVSAEALVAASAAETGPLSLYLHLPFCESLCWFCGCHTITTRDRTRADDYLDLLECEVAQWARRLQPGREVVQLHLGGGTPNFLTPEQLDRLGRLLKAHFRLAPDAEVSAELDPRTLSAEQLEPLRSLGLNRASFGVQDLDPAVQAAIHRTQPAALNAQAMAWLRAAGVGSVNIDLIYGLPLQTPESFRETVRAVVALQPDRLAVFNYAHVPWMKPAQRLLERHPMPQGDAKLALLAALVEELTRAGYCYVGMDHFARPTDELVLAQAAGTLQRNFQGYSTRAGAEILGLGVSSISQTTDTYRQNQKDLATYGQALRDGRLPVARGYHLSREDRLRRHVIMELMCNLHLDLGQLSADWSIDAATHFAPELARLRPMADDGLVELRSDHLRVTPLGRWFLRNLAMTFDAYLPPEGSEPGTDGSSATRYSRTI